MPVHYALCAPGGAVCCDAGAAGCLAVGPFMIVPAQGVLQPRSQHLVSYSAGSSSASMPLCTAKV